MDDKTRLIDDMLDTLAKISPKLDKIILSKLERVLNAASDAALNNFGTPTEMFVNPQALEQFEKLTKKNK